MNVLGDKCLVHEDCPNSTIFKYVTWVRTTDDPTYGMTNFSHKNKNFLLRISDSRLNIVRSRLI